MAIVECAYCGYKALRLAQRKECPACSEPYQFSNASQAEEYIPEDSATSFQASILEVMETIFGLKSWEEVRDVIEQQQKILLSPDCFAFMREVSAAVRQEENDAIAEHIDMYLNIFE